MKNRHFLRRFLDIPTWIGAGQLADGAKTIRTMISDIARVNRRGPQVIQTFDEAVERYQYTDEYLLARQRFLLLTTRLYLFCLLLSLMYATHLFNKGMIMACFTTSCVSLILMSFAFRAHFWYTQIKYKKLGMTFYEWFRSLFEKANEQV